MTRASKVTTVPVPPTPGFMEGVVRHLEAYAKSAGIKPENVHVRLVLADGTTHLLLGLKVSGPFPPGALGWGMIEGVIGSTTEALVVRESHVLKIEFERKVVERKPIGLHTEAGK